MASYTDLPEDGRGRRELPVAVAFLVLAAVVLYLPQNVQGRLADGIRGTVLRPFILTQEALARVKMRSEDAMVLQAKLDSLGALVASQGSLAEENAQLRDLLDLSARAPAIFVHANAIRPGTPGSESMFLLDVGTEQGVQVGDPVLMRTDRVGLVGVIQEVRSRAALGIDWSHPDFRASGVTADGRVFGLVQPFQEDAFVESARLRMNGVPYYETLDSATLITTSGLGGVFPRGIPIGEILEPIEVVPRWRKDYILRPVVETGRVLHVLVVLADSLTESTMALFQGEPAGEGEGL